MRGCAFAAAGRPDLSRLPPKTSPKEPGSTLETPELTPPTARLTWVGPSRLAGSICKAGGYWGSAAKNWWPLSDEAFSGSLAAPSHSAVLTAPIENWIFGAGGRSLKQAP